MRIAVYGASGMIGSRITAEALSRGHQVTALSRSGTEVPGATSRTGALGDAGSVREVAAAHDVVVSATGPSRTGGDHEDWLDAIRTAVANVDTTRFAVVGGAGSLQADGVRLMDTAGFPPEYLAEATTGAAALALIREAPADVDWMYLSPAPEIAPGERSGDYQVATETPAGGSVSAEDYAVAFLDELENPRHRRERFTVAN